MKYCHIHGTNKEWWVIFMIKGNYERGMTNIDYNVRLWVIPGHYRVFVDGDTGINEPLNRSEFSKRGSRNPRTTVSVWIFKGGCRDLRTAESVRIFKAGWRNPRTSKSVRIFEGDAGIDGPPNRSEFLKGMQGYTNLRIGPIVESGMQRSTDRRIGQIF